MKKYLAAIAAITMMTAAFTGCSGKNNNSSGSSSVNESSSAAENSSTAGNSSASESTTTSENSSAADPTAPETTERTAKDLANAVFQSVDWVSAQEISDAETLDTMLGLDQSLLEDYAVYVPMMSVHLDELIIVKPNPGSEPAVEEQLNSHLEYIKEGAAYYPAQEIAAAGAVMGKTDDGFYYVIVHQIGSEIADVIRDYQPGDEVPKLEVPEADHGDNGVTIVPTEEQQNG